MHLLHNTEDTRKRIRIVSTDHTTIGAVLAGVPAGKDAAQKHPTMLSGAHRHGKETPPGQLGTGPWTDTANTRGPTTNGNQMSNGGKDNLGGQQWQRQHNHINFLLYSPPLLLPSLLCNLPHYASARCLWSHISHWLGFPPFLASPPKRYTWVEFLP